MLIDLLGKLPKDLVEQMSPEAGSSLQRNLKVPAVFMCLTSGLTGGTSLVMIKCMGEIVHGPELSTNLALTISLGAFGFLIAVLQTYMLNMSMKHYNNIDVMPMHQSFTLLSWLISGLVLLDESKFYTWGELAMLFASAALIIIGIFILTKKQAAGKVAEVSEDIEYRTTEVSKKLLLEYDEPQESEHMRLLREQF